jgi:hypothetical protein
MLAELFTLKQSLEAAGQGIGLTHRDFQSPPGLSSYKTLIAKINDAGNITNLRMPLEDELTGLWTLKKGNFKFFPAVRLENPIFPLDITDHRREQLFSKAASRTLDLAGWLSQVKELEREFEAKANAQNFISLGKEQGGRILKWEHEGSKQLTKLKSFVVAFDAFSKSPTDSAIKLLNAVLEHGQTNASKDLLNVCSNLLVGQKKEKKGKPSEIEFKLQIIFDYEDPNSIAFTLHDKEMHQTVLRGLTSESGSTADNHTSHTSEYCAFQSNDSNLLTEPFGGFAARPVINKEQAPYSKKGGSQGVPCNDRYHRAEAEGFPIGLEISRTLVGAIKGVTGPENSDKTWRTLKNGKIEEKNGKKKESYDILVAFPDFELSDESAPVAPFGKRFVTSDEEEELTPEELEAKSAARRKAGYQQVTEPVCLAFEEKLKHLPQAKISILLIRQISPGQIQLAYGSRISIRHFLNAVRRWQATEGNLPASLKIPVPFKGADGLRSLAPSLLFPEEIGTLLTHQWVRDGSQSARLNAPPVGTILDLFLHRLEPSMEKSSVRNLLESLLLRSQALLIHGGVLLRQDPTGSAGVMQKFTAPKGNSNDPKWALLRTVSLIGTFLSLLDSPATTYMKEPAYLTGYLLACADELHIQYHNANSGGKLPSSLMGNALLGRASESPASALAELMERSRIYLNWAKTADMPHVDETLKADKTAEGRKKKQLLYAGSNAKRAVEQMEEIAPNLLAFYSSADAPTEFDVAQKAQLFLGYLTPIPRPSKSDPDSKPDLNSSEPN